MTASIPKAGPTRDDFSAADAAFASEVRELYHRAIDGHEDDETASPEARRMAAALLAIHCRLGRVLASDSTDGKVQSVDAGIVEALSLISAIIERKNHPVWRLLRGSSKGRARGNPSTDAYTELSTAYVFGAIRALQDAERVNETEACRIFWGLLSDGRGPETERRHDPGAGPALRRRSRESVTRDGGGVARRAPRRGRRPSRDNLGDGRRYRLDQAHSPA
ncbi:hypothetical protein [Microvirga pudoricolor]|uniref:hypothetical protein n=1 Tax=Microvirga pudoricolor TaxID=2778729 RepID=UPI0019511C6D|nr:hypothetical protein [Microvirga pudoricolor]MBM6593092.1 hypothetical protein [Microvirga pudoricolor]